MVDIVPIRPIRWDKLRADEAERVIRDRVENGAVVHTYHSEFESGDKRSLTRAEAERILREGYADTPYINDNAEWQVHVSRRRTGGGRVAVVVTVLPETDEVVIVRTVMWEDL